MTRADSSADTADSTDEALLARLGRIAADLDPPPPLVLELGRAAFATRLLGAELAALVEDSAAAPVGVRSAASDTRLLSFSASGTTIELQVSDVGGRLSVLGQIAPSSGPDDRVVHLQTASGTAHTTGLDAVGGFRFDDLPLGALRVHFEPHAGPPITTPWISS